MPILDQKGLTDANLSVSKALPAAGASNDSASIDLGTTSGGRVPRVELEVSLPATPALVDAKTITLTVQDSADNSSFAAVADIPAIVLTGAGGVGAAAYDHNFKLPLGIRKYLRLHQAVLAAGGDNTGVSSSLKLVF
jgi:hypothetical protein